MKVKDWCKAEEVTVVALTIAAEPKLKAEGLHSVCDFLLPVLEPMCLVPVNNVHELEVTMELALRNGQHSISCKTATAAYVVDIKLLPDMEVAIIAWRESE